ncbi:MAG: hypothetical protein QOI22_1970 [Verrucomicrobiota bacterium]
MNTQVITSEAAAHESTYALLVRSEEKSRNAFEMIAFTLFILSAVFSIWQVAHQPVLLPAGAIIGSATAQTVQQEQVCVQS